MALKKEAKMLGFWRGNFDPFPLLFDLRKLEYPKLSIYGNRHQSINRKPQNYYQ